MERAEVLKGTLKSKKLQQLAQEGKIGKCSQVVCYSSKIQTL